VAFSTSYIVQAKDKGTGNKRKEGMEWMRALSVFAMQCSRSTSHMVLSVRTDGRYRAIHIHIYAFTELLRNSWTKSFRRQRHWNSQQNRSSHCSDRTLAAKCWPVPLRRRGKTEPASCSGLPYPDVGYPGYPKYSLTCPPCWSWVQPDLHHLNYPKYARS
jgi:hypothetical protein